MEQLWMCSLGWDLSAGLLPRIQEPPRSCAPSSLGCGDPTVTRPSLHVSSFCRQEEPIHVSSHFISKDQKVSLVRMQINTCPNDWGYFAEVTVKNELF